MAGTPSPRPSIVLFALAIGVGIALRLDQFASQLLLEDEWHAVYRVVHDTPSAIFLDFGHSDSSIPLTLLYFAEAHAFGLSEMAMRWPMLLAGIATLILLPWYVAQRIGRAEALLFAALLAISPLLYFFSRMARPYELTLILVYVAHLAFRRAIEAGRPNRSDTLLYAASASLAAWLHPVTAPFVVAPFVPAAWRSLRGAGRDRAAFVRLVELAIFAGVPMAVLLLPPLFAHPESLSLKSGVDLPRVDTLVGVWYAWFGTGSTTVLAVCVLLAIVGAPTIWLRLPEAGSLLAGVALTALMIVITRPAWIGNPLTFGRYLLPMLPLLLLATACGALRFARAISTRLAMRGAVANALVGAIAVTPVMALAATTPLAPLLVHPNANSMHLLYAFDFRPDHNPVIAHMASIPLSPWWATLASQPPSSVAIAVAPFPTESAGWDAPRWQRVSRQRILAGLLTPLCASPRESEMPDDARFAFRNAVHLGSAQDVASHGVDYVVWQKPYRYVAPGIDVQVAIDVAPCGSALRARFGAPAYEDAWLDVYRVSRP
jgi:hypothetical protein